MQVPAALKGSANDKYPFITNVMRTTGPIK